MANGFNGGNQPPGPEELFRQLGKEFERFMQQMRGRFHLVGLGVLAVFVLSGVFSSFYTVQPEEKAVVLRFGAFVSTESPGLHFKLPWGADKVIKLPIQRVLNEDFGYTSSQSNRTRSSNISIDEESLMLSGDLNLADVEWTVEYVIADPKKFLFNARDPRVNIRDVSLAIMRRVVGDRLVSDVFTTGGVEIATQSMVLMQEILDKYDLGIRIVKVNIKKRSYPDLVVPAVNDVNTAKQEQEQLINQAEKKYNQVIPRAKGKAEETISNAQGFAAALVNRAKGDANKFNAMLTEYKRAPAVTRKRIYIETLEELFGKFKKLTIVDTKVKGVLPVFGGKNLVKPPQEKE